MYEEFMKSVKILSTIESYELLKIVDAVKSVKYNPDDYIIKAVNLKRTQGEQGNIFYLMNSGEAYATKDIDGEIKTVMEYTSGSYFGELALIKDEPRAANVIAKVSNYKKQTECECLTLDRHSCKRLLGPIDEILKRNMKLYKDFIMNE